MLNTYNPHLVAASETWFKDFSITNIQGYNVFRNDRTDGRNGGGVALYIKDSINSYELNDPGFNVSKIEMIWVVIYFGSDKYLIGCINRSKEFIDMNDFDSVFKQAREYRDQKGFKDLLIMGDFNFPLINWSKG